MVGDLSFMQLWSIHLWLTLLPGQEIDFNSHVIFIDVSEVKKSKINDKLEEFVTEMNIFNE